MKRLATAAVIAGGMLAGSVSTAGAATLKVEFSFTPEDAFGDTGLEPFPGAFVGSFIKGSFLVEEQATIQDYFQYNVINPTIFIDGVEVPAGVENYRGISGAEISIGNDLGGKKDTVDAGFRLNTEIDGYLIASIGFIIGDLGLDFIDSANLTAETLYALQTQRASGVISYILADGSMQCCGEYRDVNGDLTFTVTPVPIPAALPLLLTALGGLGFFGWRRKRVAS